MLRVMPVRRADPALDLTIVRVLFREYAQSLGFALDFQGFESELAALPGEYAEPRGTILLAHSAAGEPVGRGRAAPARRRRRVRDEADVRASEARGRGLGRISGRRSSRRRGSAATARCDSTRSTR
jgi:hypothetical protein